MSLMANRFSWIAKSDSEGYWNWRNIAGKKNAAPLVLVE